MPQKLKSSTEKLRFILVGGANTAIDFGVLFSLTSFGLPVLIANFFSTTCAFIFSFFVNRSYTFKSTGGDTKKQLGLFLAITLTGIWLLQPVVILVCQAILIPLNLAPHLSVLISKFIATLFSLTWNYLWYSRVVFKKNDEV